jgi:hypothetical protein
MTDSLNLKWINKYRQIAADFNFIGRWLEDIRLVFLEIFGEHWIIILFWAALFLIKQAWVHLWLVLRKWSKLYDMQGQNQGKADMVLLR